MGYSRQEYWSGLPFPSPTRFFYPPLSWRLFRVMLIELVMLSNRLILCHPFFLLPSIFPSIRVLSSKSALCIRWPKYCSFSSASVLPMKIQGRFPLVSTDLISLQSKGLSRAFFSTTIQKHFSFIQIFPIFQQVVYFYLCF